MTRLIFVPFNAAGVPTGVARMPQAIHSAGVEHRLSPPVEVTWIEVSGLSPQRGPSGLLSEDTLVSPVVKLHIDGAGIELPVWSFAPVTDAVYVALAARRAAGVKVTVLVDWS